MKWEIVQATGVKYVRDENGNNIAGMASDEQHAALIAAAPELLAALESIVSDWDMIPANQTTAKTRKKAHSAIARAKGDA